MTTNILLTDWERIKDRLRRRWDRFTDETLQQIAGSRETLVAKVQEYYQISPEEAQRQVREMESELAGEQAAAAAGASAMEREIMATERRETQAAMQEMEALKRDLKNLRADMRDMLQHAGAGGKYKLEDAKMRLRESLSQLENRARSQARDTYDSLREQSENVIDNVRVRVGEKPFAALGIAFVVGLIASLLLRRK